MRGVCLAPGDSINHLDHLVPIAQFMNVPILVDEESLVETIDTYYPQVTRLYIAHHTKVLEAIATQFDYLFVSSSDHRADLSPLFEIVFRKTIHFWYCPHGHSDKMYEQFKGQSLVFIYGNQMQKRLQKATYYDTYQGVVRTGNYRLSFYRKYESFYDNLAERDVFSKFEKKQRTFLYAPTWLDKEKQSSLLEIGIPLIDQLPETCNLIVKMHPWMTDQKAGYVTHLQERYKDRPNLIILPAYPLVYPLLKRTDVYLGDFSSVGYDFLYYNRPMFFFDPKNRTKTRSYSNDLHQCGILIPEKDYGSLFSFIDAHLEEQKMLEPVRAETYLDVFGKERKFESIAKEVTHILSRLPKSSNGEVLIELSPRALGYSH